MYEKALAFLQGDQQVVLSTEKVRSLLTGWEADGFQLRLAMNLPYGP
jgi:hypothetical protein